MQDSFFWLSLGRQIFIIMVAAAAVKLGRDYYHWRNGIKDFKSEVLDVLKEKSPLGFALYFCVEFAVFGFIAGCAILGSV